MAQTAQAERSTADCRSLQHVLSTLLVFEGEIKQALRASGCSEPEKHHALTCQALRRLIGEGDRRATK